MSVIMAGHAGRVPLSPAHGKKTKKPWILSIRQPSPQKQYTVLLHFTTEGKSMFCACSSQEVKLWLSSPGLLHTLPDVFFSPGWPCCVSPHCSDSLPRQVTASESCKSFKQVTKLRILETRTLHQR